MLKSIGILLIAVVILLIEVPPLLKKKYKKEVLALLIFLLIGVGLSVAQSFGKTIPNPVKLLYFVLNPLYEAIASLWK